MGRKGAGGQRQSWSGPSPRAAACRRRTGGAGRAAWRKDGCGPGVALPQDSLRSQSNRTSPRRGENSGSSLTHSRVNPDASPVQAHRSCPSQCDTGLCHGKSGQWGLFAVTTLSIDKRRLSPAAKLRRGSSLGVSLGRCSRVTTRWAQRDLELQRFGWPSRGSVFDRSL